MLMENLTGTKNVDENFYKN